MAPARPSTARNNEKVRGGGMSILRARLKEALLAIVPPDGTTIGNTALRRGIESHLATEGVSITEEDYWQVHADLISEGVLVKGQDRGGSVRRVLPDATGGDDFSLAVQAPPEPVDVTVAVPRKTRVKPSEPVVAKRAIGEAAAIISYRHPDKRKKN